MRHKDSEYIKFFYNEAFENKLLAIISLSSESMIRQLWNIKSVGVANKSVSRQYTLSFYNPFHYHCEKSVKQFLYQDMEQHINFANIVQLKPKYVSMQTEAICKLLIIQNK